MTRTLTVLLAFSAAAHAALPAADSVRGAQVFQTQHCVECHAVNGVGAKVGPDLGAMADRGFTPDMLASTLWNHAPAMWSAMTGRNIQAAPMDEQAAADLFAFFYSTHFFEKPGDATRGKRLFTSLSCSRCHGITESNLAAAKPVAQWTTPADPIAMIEVMWNHAANMRDEMARQKINWPRLSGQDVSDVLVYIRDLAPAAKNNGIFRTTSGANAQALFQMRCSVCHTSAEQFLSKNLRGETLTDLAADMWNHGPIMKTNPVRFEPGEMREIVSLVWSQRYLENKGNLERGKKVFAAKKCSECHKGSGRGVAPPLTSRERDFSGITMISVLWEHGPAMLDRMRQAHIPWPRFSTREMSDLIAYLEVRDSSDAK
jgi:mono/diheme cytochrome c family protein